MFWTGDSFYFQTLLHEGASNNRHRSLYNLKISCTTRVFQAYKECQQDQVHQIILKPSLNKVEIRVLNWMTRKITLILISSEGCLIPSLGQWQYKELIELGVNICNCAWLLKVMWITFLKTLYMIRVSCSQSWQRYIFVRFSWFCLSMHHKDNVLHQMCLPHNEILFKSYALVQN